MNLFNLALLLSLLLLYTSQPSPPQQNNQAVNIQSDQNNIQSDQQQPQIVDQLKQQEKKEVENNQPKPTQTHENAEEAQPKEVEKQVNQEKEKEKLVQLLNEDQNAKPINEEIVQPDEQKMQQINPSQVKEVRGENINQNGDMKESTKSNNLSDKEKKYMEMKRRREEYEKYIKEQKANLQDKVVYEEDDEHVDQTMKRKEEEHMKKQQAEKKFSLRSNQEFLFQIENEMLTFYFSPSISETVGFLWRVFQHQEGDRYAEVVDISQDSPLDIEILENNVNRKIAKSYYFIGYDLIQVKAGNTYTINFRSLGTAKLIGVRHNVYLSNNKLQNFLSQDDALVHSHKAKRIQNSFMDIMDSRRTIWTLENEDLMLFNRKMQRYTHFQIVEMVITVSICLAQVQFIKLLFKPNIV